MLSSPRRATKHSYRTVSLIVEGLLVGLRTRAQDFRPHAARGSGQLAIGELGIAVSRHRSLGSPEGAYYGLGGVILGLYVLGA